MKKHLSGKKAAIITWVVVIALIGFYVCLFASPISYGMGYHHVSNYEDEIFECTMTFYRDGTMITSNTNFDEDFHSRYYYKDGYVFYIIVETEEAYKAEVAAIEANFDEAVATPFYADRINAFRIVGEESDGYVLIYNCLPKIIVAIVGSFAGVVVIVLGGITESHSRKAKRKEK